MARKASRPAKTAKVETKEAKTTSTNKDAIRLALLKDFGSNSVVVGSDVEKRTFGRISTGSISLDLALGGGIPIGRITQIAGEKSTCKTSLCNHIAKNAQHTEVHWTHIERKYESGREVINEIPKVEHGLLCGYSDVEGTQDPMWLRTIGVDTDNWLYVQPGGLEEALNMVHEMQKKGVQVIFLDSIDALEPTLYYETNFGESSQMGIKPRLLGEYYRKFTATNNKLVREGKLPCTLVVLNQMRDSIGMYGVPKPSGGKATEFYASVDLRIRRGDWITLGTKEDKQIIGQVVKCKTEKNKTYKQQQTCEFDFYFDEGGRVPMAHIDNAKEIVMEGIVRGVIERAGAWFKYKGSNIAQGADNTINAILSDEALYNSVRSDLFTLLQEG